MSMLHIFNGHLDFQPELDLSPFASYLIVSLGVCCCRCQIAVHQECYGARDVQDFTSWVCRACETPDVKRECCLCPLQGQALFVSGQCYLFGVCFPFKLGQ